MRTTVTELQKRRGPWPALLKAARRARGLSQSEAAARVGVPRYTWIKWENGQREPRASAIELLRREFAIEDE